MEKKFNAVAGFSVGSPGNVIDVIDNFANVYANRLTVEQYSNLGDIGNIYIGGGSSGQVLKTDGAGNLTWAIDTASAGGNATEVQFNTGGSLDGTSGFTFNKVSNTLTITGNLTSGNANLGNLVAANYIRGDGSLLTGLNASNIASGTIPSSILGNSTLYVGTTSVALNRSSGTLSLTGVDIDGSANYATFAGTVTTNAQPNITSVGTLSGLTVSGSAEIGTAINGAVLSVGNANSGTDRFIEIENSAGQFQIGTDAITGAYLWNFADTPLTLYANAEPYLSIANTGQTQILSTAPATSKVTGALQVSGGVGITGNVYANYYFGNGQNLSGLNASNVTGQVANALVAGTVYANEQPNITSLGTLVSANITGNVSSGGNIIGNGQYLESITGGNVTGQVGNALVAGTVYIGEQPNITSVGTLTDANITGNLLIGGNLTVNGITEYTNVTNLYVKDPIIEMGGNANGGALTSNDGKDRGTLLHYYTTTPVDAFMGWNNSNSEFGFGSNVSVSGEIVTWNNYGNVRVGNIIGNGQALTGITGGNVTGQVANALVASTVYSNAQPNITSVGTLSALTVTGLVTATGGGVKTSNIIDSTGTNTISISSATVGIIGNLNVGFGGAGNVTATYFIGNGSALTNITGGNVTGQVANALVAGTVYTNAQPNITSVGTLDGINATGTINLINASNVSLGPVGNVHISGGTSGQVLKTDGSGGLSWGTDSAAPGGANTEIQFNDAGTLNGVPGLTFDKFTNTLSITGNVETGEGASGNISGANYVIANYFVGNGALLTGLALSSSYSNANVANYLPTYDGNVGAAYFIGNGSTLTSITGGNVTGQVSNALISGTVYSNAQPNITSVGTLVSVNISGNVSSGGNIIGNGQYLTAINGSNVTGQVANALVASTVYSNAQPNITSVGTLASLIVTANANVGNLNSAGNLRVSGNTEILNESNINFAWGNHTLITNFDTSYDYRMGMMLVPDTRETRLFATGTGINSGNDGGRITFYTRSAGSSGIGDVGTERAKINVDGLIISTTTTATSTSTGSIVTSGGIGAAGNVYIGGNASATYFIGNGSTLTSITGANITGTVANATYATTAATVTSNAQPNITSVGNLVNANIDGNLLIGGNLTVSGAVQYTNVTNLYVKDPIIEMGGNANGGALTSNDGKDRGTLLHYYTTTPVDAFMGWDNSNSEFGFGSNVSVSGEVVTWNSYGNVRVGNIIGNGQSLTGITGGSITGQVANALVAGTVYSNAQPNITSLGTLSNLIVSGNANVQGYLFANTIVSPTTTNVTITAGSFVSEFDDTGNITLSDNVSVVNNLSAANVLTDHLLYANGVAWDLGGTYANANVEAFLPTYTGNVAANYFIGNGSALTDITGGNVTGQVGNALVAGTVYTNAQPNITSVGTLTSLHISGNANIDNTLYANAFAGTSGANVTISAGIYTSVFDELGNISLAGNVSTTANVSAGNIKTDNLLYANGVAWNFNTGGSGNYSNSNVAAYLLVNTSNISAGYFIGNGSTLTDITGGNITGQVANSLIAGTVYTAAQPNITSTGTLVSANISGNVSSGGNIIGNGQYLTSITGGNVTGQVGNALVAGTVYSNAQPNITSVGILSSVSVTANASAGNILTDNLLYANGVAWTFSNYSNTNVAAYLPTYTGNVGAAYFIGNGSTLTDITGSNVTGQVGNALVAGTVYTNAQPNITSIGTLNGLTVTGVVDTTGASNVSLGTVANLHIAGGSSGYVLTTDGAGTLTWGAAGSGAAGLVSISKDRFLTTGSANTFNLSTTPASQNLIEVVIDGLQQISNTYSLAGSTLSFSTNPAAGQVIEVTSFGAVDLTGNVGEVQFNGGGAFASSNAFTFNTGTNTLSVTNLTATGNITSQAGYVYVDNGIIAVASGNAGIFNTGISNINLGLAANVTIGSTTGTATIRGNLSANSASITNLSVDNYYSSRNAVTVTTDTIIDQFPVSAYRSAKYTMRVNSDDGYQAVEVLLVHNSSSSYVTIYGSISSSGSDIISLSSNIGSGNVRLFASTASTNTNVKILGTYVPD